MRHLKMLGFAGFAVAALSLLIGAGGASATELTCTNPPLTKVMCANETVIQATSTHTVFHTPYGDATCEHSLFEAKVSTGSATATVSGPITAFDFTQCGGWIVKVFTLGSWEIHTHPSDSEGHSGWGTVTFSGTEITVESPVLIHCVYKASSTDVGTLTGSTSAGPNPTINTSGKKLPRVGGRSGAFCGSDAELTGTYTITSPTWLDVDHAVL